MTEMRPIKEIIVHCSATKPEWMDSDPLSSKVAEIRNWHVNDRKWNDIGYHFLIDRDGQIASGRPLAVVGAHCRGHNTGSVGICLLGGHGSSAQDSFDEHFTVHQAASLRRLIDKLQEKFPITRISGHNEYAAKACPGFQVSKWLGRKIPDGVANQLDNDLKIPKIHLRMGDRGDDVIEVQARLYRLGGYGGLRKEDIDGIYGHQTASAVSSWQLAVDRPSTGDLTVSGYHELISSRMIKPKVKTRTVEALADAKKADASVKDAKKTIGAGAVVAVGGLGVGVAEIAAAANWLGGDGAWVKDYLLSNVWLVLVLVGVVMCWLARRQIADFAARFERGE